MNSPTEQRLGAAFRDLVEDQPFIPDTGIIEQHAHQARRRDRMVRGGIGAGIVAVAAAAAVGVVSAIPASTPRAAGTHPARTGTATHGTRPPLVKLAAFVAAQAQPAGDATLVERKTGAPGQASIDVWDLYTDDGRYFFSPAETGLPDQVKNDNNRGDGMFGREVAAATSAVTGDLNTAVLKMAWPYATPVPAWLKAQATDIKAGTQIDNYVWVNSEDALIAGAGNPQVRAGVLRLLSLLPDIKVTQGSTDGQPTMTITQTLTADEFKLAALGRLKHGDAAKAVKADPKTANAVAYSEAITINAHTGIPLQIASGPTGQAATVVASYVVTRVSLADIAAGKF